MKEVQQEVVTKIINRIYKDALNKNSAEYFIILKYKPHQFKNMIDEDAFKAVVGFLPNTNHKGRPLVMSVSHNIKTSELEVTVKNPRTKI